LFGINIYALWDKLENACERSYDKINKLKSLSDWLMKDRPDFIVGESHLEENKWQKCIKVLIFEFQQHIDNHLHKGAAKLPTRVKNMLSCPRVPTDNNLIRPCIILSMLCWI
jgi:hypothetical protein